MLRVLSVVLLLAATRVAAGDYEIVKAAINRECGGLTPKARRVCEQCFIKHWPEASRCANRCTKGDSDCITVCQYDFDMQIGACTLEGQ